MSFDGHVFIRFPGDSDVDDVVTAGEAESGDGRTSSEEVRSPSSQSPGNLIKTLRLKGEGKLKEDDSEDDLDDSSLSSWHSRDNPKDPKEGNLKPGNFTVADFNARTKKEIKSRAKRESDVKQFRQWLVERKEWFERNRVEWKTEHETIGEKIEENFKHFLQQKIEGMNVKHEHTRNRLLYVLDNMTGWTYVKLWWMVVLCFEKIDRGPYGTPKESKGNEKDEGKRTSSTKREFANFTKRLDEWIAVNIPQKNTFNDNMFIQHAKQVTKKDDSMSEKTKRRLNYVLEKEGFGRSDIFWITLESFGVTVGTKGSYNKRRKTEECNSDD